MKLINPSTHPAFIKLGQIMVDTHGDEQLMESYGMTEPDLGWFGYYALEFGDINPDGTEN